MPTLDRAQGQVGAVSAPGREFGSSAVLASLALAGSFAALGLNSISISRIEGADGAGLIALSTQFILLATFVAGAGLRTSVTYRVGAGLCSAHSAVRGVLLAALTLGFAGAVIGFAAGWAVGGLINALWAARYARLPEARVGPEHGVRQAGGFGARAWVNDLFQLINVRPDLFILSAYYGIADAGVYAVTVSITSLVWIVSQPLASVVLPRNAMVFASADPGLTPVIPEDKQGAAVRHSVLISAAAALLVI